MAGGERLALVGPNGAGKSRLLRALTGVLVRAGSVRLCGTPIDAVDREVLARPIAVVPELCSCHSRCRSTRWSPWGACRTSRRSPGCAADRAAVASALERVGIAELAEARRPGAVDGGARSSCSSRSPLPRGADPRPRRTHGAPGHPSPGRRHGVARRPQWERRDDDRGVFTTWPSRHISSRASRSSTRDGSSPTARPRRRSAPIGSGGSSVSTRRSCASRSGWSDAARVVRRRPGGPLRGDRRTARQRAAHPGAGRHGRRSRGRRVRDGRGGDWVVGGRGTIFFCLAREPIPRCDRGDRAMALRCPPPRTAWPIRPTRCSPGRRGPNGRARIRRPGLAGPSPWCSSWGPGRRTRLASTVPARPDPASASSSRWGRTARLPVARARLRHASGRGPRRVVLGRVGRELSSGGYQRGPHRVPPPSWPAWAPVQRAVGVAVGFGAAAPRRSTRWSGRRRSVPRRDRGRPRSSSRRRSSHDDAPDERTSGASPLILALGGTRSGKSRFGLPPPTTAGDGRCGSLGRRGPATPRWTTASPDIGESGQRGGRRSTWAWTSPTRSRRRAGRAGPHRRAHALAERHPRR